MGAVDGFFPYTVDLSVSTLNLVDLAISQCVTQVFKDVPAAHCLGAAVGHLAPGAGHG